MTCMRNFSAHSRAAHFRFSAGVKGFTLVELIVVITIMVAMMALAASMLRGGGRAQGLQSAVEMVDGMVQEARLDAMGKGTWSRLIIVSTPDDASRNMRTLGVMSKNTRTGKWQPPADASRRILYQPHLQHPAGRFGQVQGQKHVQELFQPGRAGYRQSARQRPD